MVEWSYAKIKRDTVGVHLMAGSDLHLQWVAQQFPLCRVKGPYSKDGYWSICFDPRNEDSGVMHQVILGYLGSQGWEPFAAEGETVHLKRPA